MEMLSAGIAAINEGDRFSHLTALGSEFKAHFFRRRKDKFAVFGCECGKVLCLRSIDVLGETKTIKDWSQDSRCRIGRRMLQERLDDLGWEPELAITKPPRK